MAENKKSFILYADQIHLFENLEDDEAGRLIKHIFKYVNDQNPECSDKITKISFEPIKQQLKRDLEKWDGMIGLRTENGRRGGLKSGESRRSKQNEAKRSNTSKNEANEAVNVNVNVNDNVNDIYIEKLKISKKFDNTSLDAFFEHVTPLSMPAPPIVFPERDNELREAFKKEFGIEAEKYWTAAVSYSAEGNKKVDWLSTVKAWKVKNDFKENRQPERKFKIK